MYPHWPHYIPGEHVLCMNSKMSSSVSSLSVVVNWKLADQKFRNQHFEKKLRINRLKLTYVKLLLKYVDISEYLNVSRKKCSPEAITVQAGQSAGHNSKVEFCELLTVIIVLFKFYFIGNIKVCFSFFGVFIHTSRII